MRRHLSTVFVSVLTTALVAMGAVALGDHQFPDVDPTSAFHDDIDDFVNAGCASGFPDGSFRPQDPVKRQQMARFFAACGGRVDYDDRDTPFTVLTTAHQVLASVSIDAGALVGGGFVLVTASVRVTAAIDEDTEGPCRLLFQLVEQGAQGGFEFMTLVISKADSGPSQDLSGTMIGLVEVAAGETATVELQGRKDTIPSCPGQINADGPMAALYVPFAGDGSGGGEA